MLVSEKRHLLIPTSVLGLLTREAIEAYPEECCGVLVGRIPAPAEPRAEVREAVAARNSATDRRQESYVIDPRLLLRVQKEARERELEILGYYHSHPDHSATPSRFDLETAWPDVHYLILAVEEERVTGVRSWLLREGGEAFEEVDIEYSSPPARSLSGSTEP
jgi:proteasome lid subunit RPN8/RPN11